MPRESLDFQFNFLALIFGLYRTPQGAQAGSNISDIHLGNVLPSSWWLLDGYVDLLEFRGRCPPRRSGRCIGSCQILLRLL